MTSRGPLDVEPRKASASNSSKPLWLRSWAWYLKELDQKPVRRFVRSRLSPSKVRNIIAGGIPLCTLGAERAEGGACIPHSLQLSRLAELDKGCLGSRIFGRA